MIRRRRSWSCDTSRSRSEFNKVEILQILSVLLYNYAKSQKKKKKKKKKKNCAASLVILFV
jgi:hypothetical protein